MPATKRIDFSTNNNPSIPAVAATRSDYDGGKDAEGAFHMGLIMMHGRSPEAAFLFVPALMTRWAGREERW